MTLILMTGTNMKGKVKTEQWRGIPFREPDMVT